MVPRYFVGIDPDVRCLSFAVINKHGKLVRVHLTKMKTKDTGLDLVAKAVKNLPAMDWSGCEVTTVIEIPCAAHTKKSTMAGLQGLMNLSAISGAWAHKCPWPRLVMAQEWKGSTPKHVPQARAYKALGIPYELKGGKTKYAVPTLPDTVCVSEGINQGDWLDISDSVAIAWWGYKTYGGK